jgi:hypothetical protein
MRVCHPGPVARHRSITSGGSRNEIACRGLGERGRPPLFTRALRSALSVSSGSSRYSCGRNTCASIFLRSDFKVRREARLFTGIGFRHAENVARRATRRVPDDHQTPGKPSITNNATFTVVLPVVVDLDSAARQHHLGVIEIETALVGRVLALRRVVGPMHEIMYIQIPDRARIQVT